MSMIAMNVLQGNVNLGVNNTSSAADMILDLHGYNTAVSRACIRSALMVLRKEALAMSSQAEGLSSDLPNHVKEYRLDSWRKNSHVGVRNMIIITGIGRNSKEWLEPVLKPVISSWLYYDFSPPLVAYQLQDNPGRYNNLPLKNEIVYSFEDVDLR